MVKAVGVFGDKEKESSSRALCALEGCSFRRWHTVVAKSLNFTPSLTNTRSNREHQMSWDQLLG